MRTTTSSFPTRVTLVEVGPRDGLQNESQAVSSQVKIELIERLVQAGVRKIEAAAFVSPKWVPQMADGSEVLARVRRRPGTVYAALVPNLKGFEAAHAARADEVVVFSAASETFCQKNINCSIAESIERFAPVCEAAQKAGIAVRGSISCSLGCPYEGPIGPDAVASVARRMKDVGVQLIGVADTIGVGTPRATQDAIEAVLDVYPLASVSGHFHDTYGQALANVYACLQMGVATFDASVAGLGGCPFARGATGNVATEDVLYLLAGLQIETGVDLAQLVQTGQWISGVLGRKAATRAGNAISARAQAGHQPGACESARGGT
jgi:hydroxymethylglutaryl-CoA lyase